MLLGTALGIDNFTLVSLQMNMEYVVRTAPYLADSLNFGSVDISFLYCILCDKLQEQDTKML